MLNHTKSRQRSRHAEKPEPVRGSAPVPADSLEEISFYLGRAYYNYVGLLERVLQDQKLDEHVRPGMGHILFALFEQDDSIIKELVARTGLSPSTLTGMLVRMERSGLVQRRKDPEDGRAVRVRLTPLGRSLRSRCFVVLEEVNAVLHAGFAPDEIETMKRGFAQMISSMQQSASSNT